MAKKGPLKKVIREFGVAERLIHGTMVKGPWLMEELECGHIIRKPSDLHGEYDAVRRRCVQCAAAQPTLAPDKGQAGGSIGQESLPLAGKA